MICVAELIASLLDATRLLFDLQRANDIAQQFSGCLDPTAIARSTTDGLVERFNCAFARIWLVEPDRASLRLVASSGLYTRTDGGFARVPMGAYKVGKIAQNRVSFLSNNLAAETWVKDREWAIANRIRGFAGFPLTVRDRVIGVLATFSHDAFAPEFLEVLQVLCTMGAIALETALCYQQEIDKREKAAAQSIAPPSSLGQLPLSDQLAAILANVRLTLIGTEQPLTMCHTYLFLQVAETLSRMDCRYCRLMYQADAVVLEAIATAPTTSMPPKERSPFGWFSSMATCVGGQLQCEAIAQQQVVQISLMLPYVTGAVDTRLQIRCRFPVLQLAFTHLAQAAGISLCEPALERDAQTDVPLLTDDPAQLHTAHRIIWVRQESVPVPQGIHACIDLTISAGQLRQVLATLERGETCQNCPASHLASPLSEREREILALLAEGKRDRDIANHLIISESTVKFHLNNVLTKLQARTRFQALNQAIRQGWI